MPTVLKRQCENGSTYETTVHCGLECRALVRVTLNFRIFGGEYLLRACIGELSQLSFAVLLTVS